MLWAGAKVSGDVVWKHLGMRRRHAKMAALAYGVTMAERRAAPAFLNQKKIRIRWTAALSASLLLSANIMPAALATAAPSSTLGNPLGMLPINPVINGSEKPQAKLPDPAAAKADDKSPDKKNSSEEQDRKDASATIDSNSEEITGANSNYVIDDVKVEGNRLVSTDDIMHVIKSKRGDKFDRDQVMQDLKSINGLGYFDDRSLQVVPELTGSGVLLKIRVQENAPVTQFSIQGNHQISSEEISKAFSGQLGRPQNLNDLSQSIEQVEQLYHTRGYVLARVTDVKDDPDGSIGLTINEGVVDKIQISGNHKTKDYIIRSHIKVRPGSVYDERELTTNLRKLFGEGYFSDIRRSIVPSATNPDKYTLKVEVDEKRSGSVGLGGGIDSIQGPFGSLSFSDGNFQGKGQMLSFSGQTSLGSFAAVNNFLNNGGVAFLPNMHTYNLSADWVEPHLHGSDTQMAVNLSGRDFQSVMIPQAMQRTLGTGVTFSRALDQHTTFSLGFNGDYTSMQDVGSYFGTNNILNSMATRAQAIGAASNLAQANTLANNVRSNMLKGGVYASVNPSLRYQNVDNKLDPTSGLSARVNASPNLGIGNPAFLRAGASVSKYVPITKNQTLAFNVQGGSSMGGVPQFAQYNLGGWNGLPGYRQFSDLGTGSRMLMGSAEMRTKLPLPKSDNAMIKYVDKNIKGVMFLDWGQVSGSSLSNSLLSRNSVGASVGIGLRMRLPMVGMVRIYYGYPLLSSVMGGRTPRFTFGFGDNF